MERRVHQQLQELEANPSIQLSALESPQLHDYSALAKLAATYYDLVQNGRVVASQILDGHKFEEVTTRDASSGTARPCYTVDDIVLNSDIWDVKHEAARRHEAAEYEAEPKREKE